MSFSLTLCHSRFNWQFPISLERPTHTRQTFDFEYPQGDYIAYLLPFSTRPIPWSKKLILRPEDFSLCSLFSLNLDRTPQYYVDSIVINTSSFQKRAADNNATFG